MLSRMATRNRASGCGEQRQCRRLSLHFQTSVGLAYLATLSLGVLALLASGAAASNTVVVGRVRVQALSPQLVRIEPQGPRGFEDNTTFMVVDRETFGAGIPLTLVSTQGATSLLTTDYYNVTITEKPVPPPSPPPPMCNANPNTDIAAGTRVDQYPNGVENTSQQQCCQLCETTSGCTAWIWQTDQTHYCWLMATALGPTHQASDRVMGGALSKPALAYVAASVVSADGTISWSVDDLSDAPSSVQWPSPLQTNVTAVRDRPRFYAPPWGPTPIPAGAVVDPALVATNGYDFRNDVQGDTYVFLMGHTMDGWHGARKEFIRLAGPTPALPNYAFGTWFTYWHSYTQAEAEGEVTRWKTDKLPIDVWALDMNWRNTSNNQDHYYNHPNTVLFPDFDAWFRFLESNNLRTYFNDHPYPQGPQTSKTEVSFRWQGLSSWLARGLTYWWFDANWKFSIPPPNVISNTTGALWETLDNVVWGAHLYYTTVDVYNANNRPSFTSIILNKFGYDNESPGETQHEHPAHHRYPVWWTGDGVTLESSVRTMVDNGVYDFKPYVHSDCGGDYRGSSGDLLRWAEHCSLGSILRFHGNEHQPWSYDNHTENVIRDYLNIRYKFIPTLISAGATATETAFPLIARCDLFYQGFPEATSNMQYLFLNDTLVAPIVDSTNNVTARSVWIPPGTWVDGWSGQAFTGPSTIQVSQPYERLPIFNKQGSFVVTATEPALRVDDTDFSKLTIDVYPHSCTTIAAEPSATKVPKPSQRVASAAETKRIFSADKTAYALITMSETALLGVATGSCETNITISIAMHVVEESDSGSNEGDKLPSFVDEWKFRVRPTRHQKLAAVYHGSPSQATTLPHLSTSAHGDVTLRHGANGVHPMPESAYASPASTRQNGSYYFPFGDLPPSTEADLYTAYIRPNAEPVQEVTIVLVN